MHYINENGNYLVYDWQEQAIKFTYFITAGGLDHLRVHPRFLHSNATSHKWVLGAFAELLDNSLDENCNGATYVKIDMLKNKKDNSRMLLIEGMCGSKKILSFVSYFFSNSGSRNINLFSLLSLFIVDNGGGMDPDKMRHCMSLGYSLKSKVKDMIGQYGNGFKTSTMRLGADVIVFSRCSGEDGKTSTQSIGLLSYTFLRSTGKEDTVVPMVDYEKSGKEWNRMKRSSAGDWDTNVETIVQWSPFSSEADLLKQFGHMKDQGTLIIIYNLWEDDQGNLELDFDADKHVCLCYHRSYVTPLWSYFPSLIDIKICILQDIQIRGVNRDEKNIEMAEQHPNSRHYLTYRHSLRSYASILYLRVPHNFRMILRGKDVEHHNIVNDMMMTNVIKYRPQPGVEGLPKDSNIVAVVTVGFVKDAAAHIDVQGFNVYHKNRLIKPFWRLWNAAGSDGRGVIGVLEANFVEPAHDKQGFERTTVLQRLETRLVQMQKSYWSTYCHKIGYAPRRHGKSSEGREPSPDYEPGPSVRKSQRTRPAPPLNNKASTQKPHKEAVTTKPNRHPTAATNGNINIGEKGDKSNKVSGVGASSTESTSPLTENENTRDELQTMVNKQLANGRKTRLLSNSEVRNLGISPTVKAVPAVDPPHTAVTSINLLTFVN
ncbi:putative histidine kinase/HSP90-like ATPase superfamily, morc, S5 domain 2 [Helianthus annuus]|nr:putative histidine kinase/HSP90-like ATPase superfamily, morc, S5 domain 2 [Helianthus annuus]